MLPRTCLVSNTDVLCSPCCTNLFLWKIPVPWLHKLLKCSPTSFSIPSSLPLLKCLCMVNIFVFKALLGRANSMPCLCTNKFRSSSLLKVTETAGNTLSPVVPQESLCCVYEGIISLNTAIHLLSKSQSVVLPCVWMLCSVGTKPFISMLWLWSLMSKQNCFNWAAFTNPDGCEWKRKHWVQMKLPPFHHS